MKHETQSRLIALLLISVIMGVSVACGVKRFRECRRVHPLWYCVGSA